MPICEDPENSSKDLPKNSKNSFLSYFDRLTINSIKFSNDEKTYPFTEKDFYPLGDIGSGRFGVVKKYRHTPSNNIIAVKCHFERIHSNTKSEALSKIRLQIELHEKLSSPGHPNIVDIYGHCFCPTTNQFLVLMEAMDLSIKDLYQKIHEDGKNFPECLIGYITAGVISGLSYCKKKEVIHRDIKPANILVNKNGKIKLCDFGESSFLEASVATTYKGTIAYWPPERFNGLFTDVIEKFDIRADIWSLGITISEVIKGSLPYETETNEEPIVSDSYVALQSCIIHANSHEIIDRVFSGKPDYSYDIRNFIQMCLLDYKNRPKYDILMQTNFYKAHENFTDENVVEELKNALSRNPDRKNSTESTSGTAISFITISGTATSSNDDITEHVLGPATTDDPLKKYEYIFYCVPIMPCTIATALINLVCSAAFIFLARLVFPSAILIYVLYVAKFIICIVIAGIKFCVKKENLSVFLIYLVIWGLNIFNSWIIIVWNYLACAFPKNETLNPYGSTPTLVKWGWGIATLFTVIIGFNQILYIYVVRWYVKVRRCKQENIKKKKKKKFHKSSPFFCVF